MIRTLAASLALAASVLVSPAVAQQFNNPPQAQPPATWNYNVAGGVSTATYPGNVVINGSATTLGPSPVFIAQTVCNGSTDDAPAIASAINRARNQGGGVVWVNATGNACVVKEGLSLPNGVMLAGPGTRNFQGFSATPQQWGSFGTWLWCQDTVNPCVTLNGNGAAVEGINFVYTQPVPGASFTPTSYPYTISMIGTPQHVSNVMIVGATQGIQFAPSWNGTACGSGGGGGSYLDHIQVGAFNTAVYMNCLNNEPVLNDVQSVNYYYATTPSVVTYTEQNLTAFDFHYVDNALINGLQSYLHRVAFNFTNDTVLGVTHSFYNGTMTNVDINIGDIAMLINGNATVQGQISNLKEQQDTGEHNSFSDILNQLQSDTLELHITDWVINGAGGQILKLGNGVGGRLYVNGAWKVLSYGQVSTGANMLTMNAGAVVYDNALKNWPFNTGTQTITGAGEGQSNWIETSYVRNWTTTGGAFSTTGTGSLQVISTSDLFQPSQQGLVQGRLLGTYTVATAAAGSGTLKLQNYGNVSAAINCSSTGSFTLDSNYAELGASPNSALGQLDLTIPAGCIVNFGNLVFLGR